MKNLISIYLLVFAFQISNAQQWGLYTLYGPQSNTKVYLVDTADTPVTYKTWTLTGSNGYSCYMLPGDTLIRSVAASGFTLSGIAAKCGTIQKIT